MHYHLTQDDTFSYDRIYRRKKCNYLIFLFLKITTLAEIGTARILESSCLFLFPEGTKDLYSNFIVTLKTSL